MPLESEAYDIQHGDRIEFCGSKQRMYLKVSYFRKVNALKEIHKLIS